jgi:predicted NBD/HSP70 family sugar kinase
MSTLGLIRRTAAAACGAFVLFAAVACQSALAQSGLPIRDIRVDVVPLRANAGDPTASWVQQELPDQLAKAMAGRMTANGGTLVVRIDNVALGPIKDSWSLDNIGGVATIGGVRQPVRATTRHQSSPIDQAMIEQSNHYRVTQLVQALTFWLAKHL